MRSLRRIIRANKQIDGLGAKFWESLGSLGA